MTTPTHQARQPAGDLRRTTPTSSDSSVSPEATDRFTLIVEVKPNLVENLWGYSRRLPPDVTDYRASRCWRPNRKGLISNRRDFFGTVDAGKTWRSESA